MWKRTGRKSHEQCGKGYIIHEEEKKGSSGRYVVTGYVSTVPVTLQERNSIRKPRGF
jgi:hypothetical protein